MMQLSEGALDKIMAGETIENPVFQILGHKKLASSSSGERYRLLLSDGLRINSFTMLATQLNHMINTDLTEFTVVQINRYAMSNVNNAGRPKRVMVILSVEVQVPGLEVGRKIGNPTPLESSSETTATPAPAAPQNKPAAARPNNNTVQKNRLNESVSAGSDITTTPIAALSPYQSRWVVKARVSNKSAVRTWSNSRGEGKLFSMDLVDESGEIRCTAFKEQCDKFFDMIEIGKVYYISRCVLKPANKQFTTLKNEYEMTMNNDTEIIPCHDNVDDIPAITYDFHPLSEIETREKNEMMDVLGIVKSYDDVQSLTARATGRELRKRDIQIVDMSNVQVTVTIWGGQAEEFNARDNAILAIKGARIGEFNNGKTLSTVGSSLLQVDPDIPEAHRLRGWWNATGRDADCRVISRAGGGGGMNGPIVTVAEAMKKSLDLTNGVETYIIKGYIGLIRKENSMYKSCPTEGCNKKVIDQSNEMYRCEKCDRDFPNFKYRLLTNMSICDWTGNQWATAFNEESERLLGFSAQEIGEMKDSDPDRYDSLFAKAAFSSNFFKIRAKKETYNDETRVKAVIGAVGPVDRKLYHSYLVQELKRLSNVAE